MLPFLAAEDRARRIATASRSLKSRLYVGKLLDAGEPVDGVERVTSTSYY